MENSQNFFTRLELLIRATGRSQGDFSVAIGKNRQYINSIIKGGNYPSSNVLKDISDKFNVSIDWLLNGEGNMFKSDNPVLPMPMSESDGKSSVITSAIMKVESTYKQQIEELKRDKDFLRQMIISLREDLGKPYSGPNSLATYRQPA